jgi:hypothetical protein
MDTIDLSRAGLVAVVVPLWIIARLADWECRRARLALR